MTNSFNLKSIIIFFALIALIGCSNKKESTDTTPTAPPAVDVVTITEETETADEAINNVQENSAQEQDDATVNYGKIELQAKYKNYNLYGYTPYFTNKFGKTSELEIIDYDLDNFTLEEFDNFVSQYVEFANNIIEKTKGTLVPNIYTISNYLSLHLRQVAPDGSIDEIIIEGNIEKFSSFDDLVKMTDKFLEYREMLESIEPGYFTIKFHCNDQKNIPIRNVTIYMGNNHGNLLLTFYEKSLNEANDILNDYLSFAKKTYKRTKGVFIPALTEYMVEEGTIMRIKRIISADELSLVTRIEVPSPSKLSRYRLIKLAAAYVDLLERFNSTIAPLIVFNDPVSDEKNIGTVTLYLITEQEKEYLDSFEILDNVNSFNELLSDIEQEYIQISQKK